MTHRLQPGQAVAAAFVLTAALLPGCGERSTPNVTSVADRRESEAPWFIEKAANAGLDFIQDSGHRQAGGRFFLPESICGGVALIDIDGDGWLDVYFIQTGHVLDPPERRRPNRLFRNLGNGRFLDVTEGSGTDHRGLGMGVAVGDFNNDGLPDLYICNLGENVLLRNDGSGRFTDVTAVAGVGHPGFGAAAAFFDFDLDGHLDLFVVNYLHWSPDSELPCTGADGTPDYCNPRFYRAPTADVLYRNNGDGTFTDISARAGLAEATGNGLGIVCADFNGDGLPDVFVANDGTRHRLWINLGNGRFEDRALELGCAIDESGIEKAGMGVVAVDLHEDGRLDVLVVNLGLETDSYFRNMGTYFIDATASLRVNAVTRRFTRFGVGLHDFNNDGWLDLYQANGRIARVPPFWIEDPYAEPNVLMRGTPAREFIEVHPLGGTATRLFAASRAAAFGDLDNDGGIDIVVVNRDGAPYLLRNIVQDRGHWLLCRIIDEHGRDALGATVYARTGGRIQSRLIAMNHGYFAAHDPRAHFGLGSERAVDDLVVRWPDGAVESFGSFDADQIVVVRRSHGTTKHSSEISRAVHWAPWASAP